MGKSDFCLEGLSGGSKDEGGAETGGKDAVPKGPPAPDGEQQQHRAAEEDRGLAVGHDAGFQVGVSEM